MPERAGLERTGGNGVNRAASDRQKPDWCWRQPIRLRPQRRPRQRRAPFSRFASVRLSCVSAGALELAANQRRWTQIVECRAPRSAEPPCLQASLSPWRVTSARGPAWHFLARSHNVQNQSAFCRALAFESRWLAGSNDELATCRGQRPHELIHRNIGCGALDLGDSRLSRFQYGA